jgi:hypothetical protein
MSDYRRNGAPSVKGKRRWRLLRFSAHCAILPKRATRNHAHGDDYARNHEEIFYFEVNRVACLVE